MSAYPRPVEEIRADVAKVRESHGSDRGYPVVRLADDVEALLARLAAIDPRGGPDA